MVKIDLNKNMKRAALYPILSLIIALGGYIYLGYYLDRSEFLNLLGAYSLLFLSYYIFLKSTLKLRLCLLLAFSFRLVLLFNLPNLSDDYFRFIWDGTLSSAGLNPWLYTPETYQSNVQISYFQNMLYENMNSPQYFTIYPTVCQAIFYSVNKLFPENLRALVLALKSLLLIAEIGSVAFILKILEFLNLNRKQVLIYALNPLIIIELVGNIHFEALMICFLLGFIWALLKRKYVLAGILFILAVHVKLLPLMFLPLIINYLGLKKGLRWALAVVLGIGLLFLPFLSSDFSYNFGSSLDLYFQKFEFNASIYYILRAIGYYQTGYNEIAFIGPGLSLATLSVILWISCYKVEKKTLIERMFWIFLVYLLGSTIVHPWYLTGLLGLALFTTRHFISVWTFTIILSYATYRTAAYHENLYLVALEYGLVLGFGIYTTRKWKSSTLK